MVALRWFVVKINPLSLCAGGCARISHSSIFTACTTRKCFVCGLCLFHAHTGAASISGVCSLYCAFYFSLFSFYSWNDDGNWEWGNCCVVRVHAHRCWRRKIILRILLHEYILYVRVAICSLCLFTVHGCARTHPHLLHMHTLIRRAARCTHARVTGMPATLCAHIALLVFCFGA